MRDASLLLCLPGASRGAPRPARRGGSAAVAATAAARAPSLLPSRAGGAAGRQRRRFRVGRLRRFEDRCRAPLRPPVVVAFALIVAIGARGGQ